MCVSVCVCVCVARNHRNIGTAEAARKKFSIYCDLLMRLEKSEVRNGRSRKGKEQERDWGGGSRAERNTEQSKASRLRDGDWTGGGGGMCKEGNGQWVQSVAAAAQSTHTGMSFSLSLCLCVRVLLASSIISFNFNNNFLERGARKIYAALSISFATFNISCKIQRVKKVSVCVCV